MSDCVHAEERPKEVIILHLWLTLRSCTSKEVKARAELQTACTSTDRSIEITQSKQ